MRKIPRISLLDGDGAAAGELQVGDKPGGDGRPAAPLTAERLGGVRRHEQEGTGARSRSEGIETFLFDRQYGSERQPSV